MRAVGEFGGAPGKKGGGGRSLARARNPLSDTLGLALAACPAAPDDPALGSVPALSRGKTRRTRKKKQYKI